MNSMTLALIIFFATYILLLIFADYRPYIALTSAVLFVVLGYVPIVKVFGVIDWNVIMMIAGTMGTVYLFIESNMPTLMSDWLINKMPNVKWVIVMLSLFAGVISAFVDNVATVLMVAPVALVIAKKLDISPVTSIIAISVSSNLQGAATLVGDTTAILLGGYAGMNFNDFFFYRGIPSMFWFTEIGAIAAAVILYFILGKETEKVDFPIEAEVNDMVPTWLLLATVLGLIVASFIPNTPYIINGLICMGFLVVGIIYEFIKKQNDLIVGIFKEIDYFTLMLLAGLFVVIAGITEAGVIEKIAEVILQVSGTNLFIVFTIIVWASVGISAFIDNIPYIATMLPVVRGMGQILAVDPTVLYFGLLIGATLGGNLTPIGASANIAGQGMLRKEGYEVSAATFMKISVPFTLAAVITGYVLTWVFWGS